jgi:predicted acetyltransferase
MKGVKIEKIPIEEKSVLRQLMELYSYDFSEYDQADVNNHGFYGYHRIDHYWTEEERVPYFIKVDDKYAGFVLVSEFPADDSDTMFWSITEFFVMKKYRRKGIGKYAACYVFDLHRGPWEVSQVYENEMSRYFWEDVISEYTGNQFEIKKQFKDGFERQFVYFDNT